MNHKAAPSEGSESAIRILRSAPVTTDPYRLEDPLPTLRRVHLPPEVKKAEPPMPIDYAEPEPLFFAEASTVKAVAYWVWVVLVMLGVVAFSSPEIRALIF